MSQPEFTEEELRQLEAEMERITVDDVLIQTTVTLLNLAARKAGLGAPPGRGARRPTGSRSARRSRAPARCCRCSSRATPSSSGRCATRSRGCRWSTPSSPAGRRAGGRARGEASRRQQPPQPGQPGPAQSSGRLWIPGPVSACVRSVAVAPR